MKNLYGLIMAGGSGTRLWPISRDYYPKQFLTLTKDNTLIQQTFTRIKKSIPAERIYITTNRIFADEIVNQLKEFGVKKENIIIQPANKDTGPAVIWAAKRIYENDKEAIIINCPSDHIIHPENKFKKAIEAGYNLASKGLLVTFGIEPTKALSEYGYITINTKKSEKVDSFVAFKVKKFIEKPKRERAVKLIKRNALWNSGIFIWKASVIIKEAKTYCQDIYAALNSRKKYLLLSEISIDKSILEKSNLVWTIPVNFKWKDIGSWTALYELLKKDSNRNVLNDRVIALNSKNSLIYGTQGRFVTAINVKDMIIVDTQDSVLISHKEGIHKIKNALVTMEKTTPSKPLLQPLVTIIVPTYNDEKFVGDTLKSITEQDYKNTEIIVIDGGSIDGTEKVLKNYAHRIEIYINIPNTSMFERVNEGIKKANGEIIGILDSDDTLAEPDIITNVVETMERKKADVLWGDLIYIGNKATNKISMYWKSSEYKEGIFHKGWAPPHPTFFVRSKIYKKYKTYNTKFRVAADYELMLRFLEKHKVAGAYIPKILVKMYGSGLTLESILNRFIGNIEVYKAWKENGFDVTPAILLSKNISRISHILSRKDLLENPNTL